jgi:hypothetical protein
VPVSGPLRETDAATIKLAHLTVLYFVPGALLLRFAFEALAEARAGLFPLTVSSAVALFLAELLRVQRGIPGSRPTCPEEGGHASCLDEVPSNQLMECPTSFTHSGEPGQSTSSSLNTSSMVAIFSMSLK